MRTKFEKLKNKCFDELSADLERVSDINNFVVQEALKPYKFIIRPTGGCRISGDFLTLKEAELFINEKVANK